jgi:hypothetical protein
MEGKYDEMMMSSSAGIHITVKSICHRRKSNTQPTMAPPQGAETQKPNLIKSSLYELY